MKDFNELSGMQIDALREIGNIGAGNAATALAQMVQTKIDMKVPMVKILPFNSVADLVGGPDVPVTGLYFTVEGSISSSILFLLPIEQAYALMNMLMGRPADTPCEGAMSEIEMSALMEVGNIVSSTYLNALAYFTNLKLLTSVPALAIDMAGAVLDEILIQFGEIADTVLVLETMFHTDENDIMGYFFLLPDTESLAKILKTLGVNY